MERVDDGTKLAFERTWLAEERTAMAWIRTSTSLITFGFAIYSFFGIPSGAGHQFSKGHRGAEIFSVMLISIGLIALASASVQHRQAVRAMKAYFPIPRRSTAGIVGSLVAVLGITALVFLIFNF